jgi:hypothetical protein
MMMSDYPYRSILEMDEGLNKSLVEGEWLPNVEYLQNNVIPARNKTNDDKPSL